MIISSNIDKNLLKKSRNYRTFYLIPYLSILVLLIISPIGALLYLIATFSVFSILDFILTRRKDKFNCIKCGLCCALRVDPTEKDILRIEKNSGKSREHFMEGKYLKKINGYCMLLKNKDGENVCSIYKFRPDICNKWPFQKLRMNSLAICPSLRALFKRKN